MNKHLDQEDFLAAFSCRMDAPEGPECFCGAPSTNQAGTCASHVTEEAVAAEVLRWTEKWARVRYTAAASRNPRTAYLCMVSSRALEFVGFEIFSSPPWLLTHDRSRIITILYQVEHESFERARQEIFDVCQKYEPYRWVWPYIDPSWEAQRRRRGL